MFQSELQGIINEDFLNQFIGQDHYQIKSKLIKIALDKINKIIDQEVIHMDKIEQELLRSSEKKKQNDALLSGKYAFFESLKSELL